MALSTIQGKYINQTSIVHRMDARIKIIMAVTYIAVLFFVSDEKGLLLLCALLAVVYACARIPLRFTLKGLRPLLYILCFTLIFSAFTFNTTASADITSTLPLLGTFGLDFAGLLGGLLLSLRLILFFCATSLITYTSTLIEIADAASALIRPLGRFGIPTEDVATVFALTLRFIPLTTEEAQRITEAQKSRGLDLEQRNLLKRAQAWIPITIPLFVSLFKRAERLSNAMNARCYTSTGRTHLHTATLKNTDILFGVLGVATIICLGILF